MPTPLFFGVTSVWSAHLCAGGGLELTQGLMQVVIPLWAVFETLGPAAEHVVGCIHQRFAEFTQQIQRALPGTGWITLLLHRHTALGRVQGPIKDLDEVLGALPPQMIRDFVDFIMDIVLIFNPVSIPGLRALPRGRCCLGCRQLFPPLHLAVSNDFVGLLNGCLDL